MANKRYDQFSAGTPTDSRILLHAEPTTGALEKCTIADLVAPVPPLWYMVPVLQKMGSPIINYPALVNNMYTGGVLSPFNQQGYYYAIWLPDCTVTGISYWIWRASVSTAANFNGFGLHSASGNVLTNIALTANDNNFFKGTTLTWRNAPFTSTVIVTAGIYYISVMHCYSAESTTPQLASNAILNIVTGVSAQNTTNTFLAYYIGALTTLATTVTLGSGYGIPGLVPTMYVY